MDAMDTSERLTPSEWTRRAVDEANKVRCLVIPIREHRDVEADLGSPEIEWSVAVPVCVGPGIPVADGAPADATAVGLALAVDEGEGIIAPGDRMRVVGGTSGHTPWPPATRVFEVETGAMAGGRVQFVLDRDPRPAGPRAVTAALVLLRADEPVLGDPARLAALKRELVDAGLG